MRQDVWPLERGSEIGVGAAFACFSNVVSPFLASAAPPFPYYLLLASQLQLAQTGPGQEIPRLLLTPDKWTPYLNTLNYKIHSVELHCIAVEGDCVVF